MILEFLPFFTSVSAVTDNNNNLIFELVHPRRNYTFDKSLKVSRGIKPSAGFSLATKSLVRTSFHVESRERPRDAMLESTP